VTSSVLNYLRSIVGLEIYLWWFLRFAIAYSVPRVILGFELSVIFLPSLYTTPEVVCF
jgi:hypothetical protein